MATIQDLKPSILELPNEEAFELIRQIRFLRRQPPQKAKTKVTKSPKKEVDLKSLVRGMSEEDRLKLLEQLEGG